MSSTTKPKKKDDINNKAVGTASNTELLTFNDDEMGIYNEVTEELKQDNENFSDLMELPPEKPDMDENQLTKLQNDPEVKTIERDPYDPPTINDTLADNSQIGMISNDDLSKIKKDAIDERNNTVAWLAGNKDIALHIYAGSKDGKAIWIEKKYYFNPISQRQQLHLNQLNARHASMSVHNTLLLNQRIDTLTDQERAFMKLAPMMIEVAGYKLKQEEARLRLGMSADDFSKVQTDEYALVQRVIEWRTLYPPHSRRGR